jgi:hypothetical protein
LWREGDKFVTRHGSALGLIVPGCIGSSGSDFGGSSDSGSFNTTEPVIGDADEVEAVDVLTYRAEVVQRINVLADQRYERVWSMRTKGSRLTPS